MANEEHLKILKNSVEAWNKWRIEHPDIIPDLARATFESGELLGANLSQVDLTETHLLFTILPFNDLSYAQLVKAKLTSTYFYVANLEGADLSGADLSGTNFSGGNLQDANFSGCDLTDVHFSSPLLKGADFTKATISATTFDNVDLSMVSGLNTIVHHGPSTIGLDTLYLSGGKLPEVFLRGCGIPDEFITYMPSLIGAQQAIEFYSCFISYSHKDEAFAKHLFSRMREEGLRVWFAPEDIKAGEKLHEQILRAIQIHDRLLIILSENSLQSNWVMTEIRNARKAELRENRRKLFPIRLVGLETIREWECFDVDTGSDLAVDVREYFIPDFSNWRDYDAFEDMFERLVRNLKAEE